MDVPGRIITVDNLSKVQLLLGNTEFPVSPELASLFRVILEKAEIVTPERVPPNVVTMNSRFFFEDEPSGVYRVAQLVYPTDATADGTKISVLAPVGMALLGLSAGRAVSFPIPGGRMGRLRVVKVLYQPENDIPPPRAA